MINEQVEQTLVLAVKEARARSHEHITVEHILYGLLQNDQAKEIIDGCGGNPVSLGQRLEDFFANSLSSVSEDGTEPVQTIGFNRVIQRAIAHVQSCGKKEVDPSDILAAIFAEPESYAVYFLKQEGLTKLDIVEYISHSLTPMPAACPCGDQQDDDQQDSALARFAINFSDRARAGKIDPLIGRHQEMTRLMQILCRRRKNNPLLVGEPGVGKTAIAEGLALHIQQEKTPELLKDVEIHQLDLGTLLSGTKYRGDFEKRLKGIITEVEENPHIILLIDEIHTIIGAGATGSGSMDVSNLLKPSLQAGTLRCIGSTTYEEYRNHIEKDRALSRRFQKIDIEEPSVTETCAILRGLQSRYEEHHGIRYSKTAIQTTAELAHRYLSDRYLPDKAIDVLDEAGAAHRLRKTGKTRKTITVRDIEGVIARMARVPARNISSSDISQLKGLEESLQRQIFGQDHAIASLVKAVKRSRAGLNSPERPTGSFLFAGPTGVGKTEVARQLAFAMSIHFERFDMSEYMEKHAVARLIGAPPGYVGFDQGGLLTDAIRKHPYTVLLLDEIEKAHPDIFNILLQVMDHSTLTDNSGRKADFRNVILIMTTNAGAKENSGQTIGFMTGKKDGNKKALKNLFSPEFRNRLDATITFNELDQKVMTLIVDKMIYELEAQLAAKKVSIILSHKARKWLATHGYKPEFGARPMRRLIMSKIGDQLSEAILFGQLAKGGQAQIDHDDENFQFTYTN